MDHSENHQPRYPRDCFRVNTSRKVFVPSLSVAIGIFCASSINPIHPPAEEQGGNGTWRQQSGEQKIADSSTASGNTEVG
jgi:hypothetical protein